MPSQRPTSSPSIRWLARRSNHEYDLDQKGTRGAKQTKNWEDKLIEAWWGKLLSGLCCFGLAYYLHVVFTDLYTGAKASARVQVWIAFLYRTVGPELTLGLIGILGLGLFLWGIKQFVSGRE